MNSYMRKAILLSISLVLFVGRPVLADIKIIAKDLPSGRLAFTYEHDGKKDIYGINFSNRSAAAIIASPHIDEYPTWSPDGTKIAFYSERNGNRDIYLWELKGAKLSRLTTHPGIDEDPHWSADGKKIVFHTQSIRAGAANLAVIELASGKISNLTNLSKQNTVPKWSPDGKHILYSTNRHWPGWDVVVFDVQNRESHAVTKGFLTSCRADWSPDGKRFAFSQDYGVSINLSIGSLDKPFESERLTKDKRSEYDPVWIDDEQILFVREEHKGKEDYQLFLLDLSRKTVIQLTSGTGSIRNISYTKQ